MFGSIELTSIAYAPAIPTGLDWKAMLYFVVFLLLAFVIPFVLGNVLSKMLRMSSHSGRIGVVLFSIFASALIVFQNKPRYGVDIAGGTILKYEIDKSGLTDAGAKAQSTVRASEIIPSLNLRLNPSGTKEIVVRPIGDDQIEIIIPNVDQMEIEEIKRIIQQAGILKFRIVANALDHSVVMDLAKKQSQSTDPSIRLSNEVRNEKNEVVAIWQTIGRDSTTVDGIQPLRAGFSGGELARQSATGEIIVVPPLGPGENALEKHLASKNIGDVDLLMTLVGRDGVPFELVTGDDLATIRNETGKDGSPEVGFDMKVAGAQRLMKLTSRNIPKAGNMSRMAIILDGHVLSAPTINSTISDRGVIQGRFTKKEVDFLVSILRSGSLPASLGKEPIGQSQTGAMLGANTIKMGFNASAIGLATTFIFMLLYYRFSGFVACIALIMNILILYAFILLIRQPITLPGLAGFVLTVGMSVDANVLVFERIREEIERRATGRMAIRNGFDNAMSTIVDSNLTTLISGIVLYALGTDQVRGFAVPLIIGIIVSMFTAVYCSRVLFDIAEKMRFISFSMTDGMGWARRNLLGNKDVDFMGMRTLCFALSGIFIVIGLVATAIRGQQILDIDFSGGSAVVFSINQQAEIEKVRQLTNVAFEKDEKGNPIQTNLTTIKVAPYPEGTVYRLETTLQKIDEVKSRLNKGFEGQDFELVTFRVDVNDKMINNGAFLSQKVLKLVSIPDGAENQPIVQDPPVAPTVSAPENTTPPAANPSESTPATTPEATPSSTPLSTPQDPPEAVPTEGNSTRLTSVELHFHASQGTNTAKIAGQALTGKIVDAAKKANQSLNDALIQIVPSSNAAGWNRESMAAFDTWKVTLPFDAATTKSIMDQLQNDMKNEPVWLSTDSIGQRVAGQMQWKAIASLLVSLFFINIYIWFRFHKVAYGLAAVIALFHDVLITLGCVALSHWIYGPLAFMQMEDFKISLTVVAAFLTIIGYSLNDTIVVFDRIREVKGKSPILTKDMVNKSVNETLSRTLLTSSTTIIAIAILYFLGGEGIHGFAFCMFIGIIVGTYSSIFVAAPLLLWMTGSESTQAKQAI